MSDALRIALALLLIVATGGTAIWAEPHTDYVLHCQGCHGPDGEGSAQGAPPFRGNVARLAATESGRAYLLRVPGTQFSELDDARLAAVLNWILERFDPPTGDRPGVRPFTADEVARLRGHPLVSVSGERARVLAGGASAK